jgi:hypothetical protein
MKTRYWSIGVTGIVAILAAGTIAIAAQRNTQQGTQGATAQPRTQGANAQTNQTGQAQQGQGIRRAPLQQGTQQPAGAHVGTGAQTGAGVGAGVGVDVPAGTGAAAGAPAIAQRWTHIGLIHHQIVQMQIGAMGGAQTRQNQAASSAQQDAAPTGAASGRSADEAAARAAIRGRAGAQAQTGAATGLGQRGNFRTEALWQQIGALHSRLIQLRLVAADPRAQTFSGQTNAAANQNLQNQNQTPDATAGGALAPQTDAQIQQIWQQITQLQQQILEIELADAAGPTATRVLRPDVRVAPDSRTGTQNQQDAIRQQQNQPQQTQGAGTGRTP